MIPVPRYCHRLLVYAVLEFVTQILLQTYLITDAINILLIFKEVKMASKEFMVEIIKSAYRAWQSCYPKSNKVAPVAPARSRASLGESSERTESEMLNE